jgi:hypothetical protein
MNLKKKKNEGEEEKKAKQEYTKKEKENGNSFFLKSDSRPRPSPLRPISPSYSLEKKQNSMSSCPHIALYVHCRDTQTCWRVIVDKPE